MTAPPVSYTHLTLPAYGLLLCGPAGTGKSQIAYAVARIPKLPWTTPVSYTHLDVYKRQDQGCMEYVCVYNSSNTCIYADVCDAYGKIKK